MNWTALLTSEIEAHYRATEGLMSLVDDDALDWTPESGSNWMTTGQLLMHLTNACGFCCKGFATGDWGPQPEGDPPPADMLPPADSMPSAETVAQAKELLAADKAVALQMVADVGEEALGTRMETAPWNPTPRPIGYQFLEMVGHLTSHKGQLFYYLKLQGKPVNTMHLWGMAPE